MVMACRVSGSGVGAGRSAIMADASKRISMTEAHRNPSALALRRRQEAIDRLNQDFQTARTSAMAPDNQGMAVSASTGSGASEDSPGYIADDGRYVPNRIALKKRVGHGLLSLGIVAYGYWGVQHDDLVVPLGKRMAPHFHQLSAWIMYAAMLCAAVHCASIVIDHYDRRHNEATYQRIGEYSKRLGWGLFGLAFLVGLLHQQIDFR